mmetsp:Transcript_47131/g.78227  ORF Transcript_47131/g.78227 Transcript_47131/m.78227 type:complete len:204 (-) Transcript_47131:66-677(-)
MSSLSGEGVTEETVTQRKSNKALQELLCGTHVMNQNGTNIALADIEAKNEVIGIYFSAHWCGPCRSFTPQFKERFEVWKSKGKKVSVVFVSLDKEKEAFDEYYRSMHKKWLTIPWKDNERRRKINENLNKNKSIPCLLFIDAKTGEINTEQGRTVVMRDVNGIDYPWKNYQAPYQPPNVWNRVLIRLLIFGAIFIFLRFYKTT